VSAVILGIILAIAAGALLLRGRDPGDGDEWRNKDFRPVVGTEKIEEVESCDE